jgi:hypothetical protein
MSPTMHALVEDVLQWIDRGMDPNDHSNVLEFDNYEYTLTLKDDDGNVEHVDLSDYCDYCGADDYTRGGMACMV